MSRFSTRLFSTDKVLEPCRFRLTFSELIGKSRVRNPLGGLSVRLPLPVAPDTRPIILRKATGNQHTPFRVSFASRLAQNEPRSMCNSASECEAPVITGQTATLARVLRATAQYSICGWGVFFTTAPSTTTSRSYAHLHLKAAEPHLYGLQVKMSREVVSL
jgi:hypothetical protein